MRTTYLDHAATTPLRPEVLEAMLPFLTDQFGNPSGSHAVSRRAKQAIEEARDAVAAVLGAGAHEVVFTGGGTEADNLAVFGIHRRQGGTVVVSAVEHHAVLHSGEAVGAVVVGVDSRGVIDVDALATALDESVTLVSVMLVNNEVGTIQPLADVVELVRRRAPQAVVHTDAVQGVSWLDLRDAAAGAHLVAISAHKFGGPKGVGALVVRDGVKLEPLIRGGGQEQERRSGTHNVAGIVGLAAALTATDANREADTQRIRVLRDRLVDGLVASVDGCVETGDRATKVAGNAHVRFAGVESEALLLLLDQAGICASAGSACASGAIEPSHVLTAMGVDHDDALSSLRLSLGVTTTDLDIDHALEAIPEAVAKLRA